MGKDEGVTGDNTIIFASDPMGTKSKFNSDTSEKKYNYSAGTGYGESDGSIDVYANHYGASVLRAALQGMETGNFTTSEQDLMNATTVTTTDLKNSVSYTTTDKLYALASGGDTTIKAGSSDQIVLSMSQYWNSNGELFSLRSPRAEQSTHVLLVRSGERVVYTDVKSPFTVRPASNLNLSSVLFASAAQAASSGTSASGTIKAGTAMTLRLDATRISVSLHTTPTQVRLRQRREVPQAMWHLSYRAMTEPMTGISVNRLPVQRP